MFFIRSLDLSHTIAESLYPLSNLTSNHFLLSVSMIFDFLKIDPMYKREHAVFIFFCMLLFYLA